MKIKLFLVDDDALYLKSLEIEFLQHADFTIETFTTGIELVYGEDVIPACGRQARLSTPFEYVNHVTYF